MKRPRKSCQNLLSLFDLSPSQVKEILVRAASLKKSRRSARVASSARLKGKTLAAIFEKPSTRTRVSFDVAMYELGGHTITIESVASQMGRGETYEDTGRVVSRYVHGIVFRTFEQDNIEKLARAASVPVINALSDIYHPCQILTDLFTILEEKKTLGKLKICYLGDGNNISNTWIEAALLLGFELRVATPPGYVLPLALQEKMAPGRKNPVILTEDPVEAVQGADVVNTDTWFSMGQVVSQKKKKELEPFQVNEKLLKKAAREAIVLHCLPAHRGEEITDGVIDGPQSCVWEEAENRLHVQKAVLEMLMG